MNTHQYTKIWRPIFIMLALLLSVQITFADQPTGHFTQMAWANAPAQQVDLDGDGEREHFAMDVSLFDDESAEGQIEIGNNYVIKVDRGTLNSDHSVAFMGTVYQRDSGESLGSVTFSVQQQNSGGGDDAPDSILWDLDGGHVPQDSDSGGDHDFPDTILWDLDGGHLVGTLHIYAQ